MRYESALSASTNGLRLGKSTQFINPVSQCEGLYSEALLLVAVQAKSSMTSTSPLARAVLMGSRSAGGFVYFCFTSGADGQSCVLTRLDSTPTSDSGGTTASGCADKNSGLVCGNRTRMLSINRSRQATGKSWSGGSKHIHIGLPHSVTYQRVGRKDMQTGH